MKHLSAVLFLATAVATTGCSVNRALNKPSPKDLSFLTQGASRDAVRSELGDFTVSADSTQCDVHSYTEGSGGAKYARAFFYSILDLGSAGIFEIFLNPIEAAIGNDKVRTKACYNDKNLLVKANEFHKGGRETQLKLIPADDPVLRASLEAPTPVAVVAPVAVFAPVAPIVAEPVVSAAPVTEAVVEKTTTEALPVDAAAALAAPTATAAVASEVPVAVGASNEAVVVPAEATPTEAAATQAAPTEAAPVAAAPAAEPAPAATAKKAKPRKASVKRKG